MLYLAAKAMISGLLIVAASEIAKRSPVLGALIISLPLISILAFIWLWIDTGNVRQIAALSQSTFFFVLPSLPMFLLLPWLLRGGFGFWLALGISCGLTILLYFAMSAVLERFGISLS